MTRLTGLSETMANDTELAILFADVVGSTRLYDVLGDERARATVGLCIDIMRRATEKHGGTVIKTMGDEVMSSFPLADDALNAAAEMQLNLSTNAALRNDRVHIAVRIGCHFGSVVVENRDVFGATVHMANRMTSQAKAAQIVTTSTMIQKLSPEWRSLARQIDVATMKGRSNEVALYEVLWQTDDVTSMVPQLSLAAREGARPKRLKLRLEDSEVTLSEPPGSVTIGRAEENDLIVRGNLISRIHARIDATKSHFVLVDQSTNGTFVQPDGGTEQFVRRDSYTLVGRGLIGFGRAPERNSAATVRYLCED